MSSCYLDTRTKGLYQTVTLNFVSSGAVIFTFDVNLKLLVQGIVFALLSALIGGLFPAIGATRQPIAHALREL